MVQFLSIIFFYWISSIFVGFFKISRFFVSPCTATTTNEVVAQYYVVMRTQRADQLTVMASGIPRSWIYINCLKL